MFQKSKLCNYLGCVYPAVQQKDSTHTTSTSTVTLVTSTPVSAPMTAGPNIISSSLSSTSTAGDFQIPTTSADVAADIAKYTNKVRSLRNGGCKICLVENHFYGFIDVLDKLFLNY